MAALIRRMTRENPRWGHMRVLGELRKLGYSVSVQTVRRYRKDVTRDPASSWQTFLTNYRPQIWASDFFTVHTLGFQTLYVFFFIAHERRTVMHVNITASPRAEWVWRQLINATPWGTGPRFLIRDRDRAYGGDFVARARRMGIRTVLTPIATPQANAIGASHRDAPPRVLGPPHRGQRAASAACARRLHPALQRGAAASGTPAAGPRRTRTSEPREHRPHRQPTGARRTDA